jgi:two-component SAPR family response regulator
MKELLAPGLKGRRVLIVEDEYLLAIDLAEQFGEIGVEVIGPAGTLDDAITLLNNEEIDGAVLDINLRGEKVYPVADILKARAVPFVFTSGYASDLEPHAYAAIPHCIKPVTFCAVARLLASQLQI